MPDIPGTSSTSTVITVDGAPINDTLETLGDHDWVRIQLTAGQKISILLDGVTLEDSYLRIRDASGNQLDENDDISLGSVLDSRLVFTAPTTGTYFIDVGAYNDRSVGTYQLSVKTWAPPQVVPISEIASFLSDGYWGGERHHFNTSQGGSISVNLTQLTPSGQTLAREALALWSDLTGISFTQVSSGGQITFDDNEDGAHADAERSNGITTSAHVNVSEQWLVDYGTSLSSYAFQTYVHEIGHALGLGHAGYYNGDAEYATEAEFANDGWPTTIMSYFDQRDNPFFTDQGFTRAWAVTPMLADIRAIGSLYGLSTTTRTGDTTYGFGNTSGRSVYSAAVGNTITALTIFDNGGIDTLNYSGFSSNQMINLNPETFSNVGGGTGNLTIAFSTIIENAIGGNGGDTLIGNGVGNILTGGNGSDFLTGGAGNDQFRDTMAGLNTDAITDFSVGDAIIFTDANISSFSFTLSGQLLSYTGGNLSLVGGISGTLVASAAAGGGVQLSLSQSLANDAGVRRAGDFNGDGRDDILWRHDDGTITNWLGTATGGFADTTLYRNVSNAWSIAGIGDFNGDGRDDILWRNADGSVTDWLGTAQGGFADNYNVLNRNVPLHWQIDGIGDFNGDGRDDILWRHNDGTITNWLGTATGGFTDTTLFRNVSNAWSIAGTGDFNGDGRDDILWRNADGSVTDWLGTPQGGFADNYNVLNRNVPLHWQIDGIGDFNGDGRDDILWRHNDGTITNWLGTATGGFADTALNRNVSNAWSIAATGDFNGDGRDDIFWRNADGSVTDWLGTAGGGFADNSAFTPRAVPTWWHVQPDGDILS